MERLGWLGLRVRVLLTFPTLGQNLCLTGLMLGSRPREEFGALSFEETARGLGLPKEWKWGDDITPLEHSFIAQTSCLFIWEYLLVWRLSAMRSRTSQIRLRLFGLAWLKLAGTDHLLLPRCRPNLAPGGSWHTTSVWSTCGWQRLVIRIPMR
jgi:hypothetical protein